MSFGIVQEKDIFLENENMEGLKRKMITTMSTPALRSMLLCPSLAGPHAARFPTIIIIQLSITDSFQGFFFHSGAE